MNSSFQATPITSRECNGHQVVTVSCLYPLDSRQRICAVTESRKWGDIAETRFVGSNAIVVIYDKDKGITPDKALEKTEQFCASLTSVVTGQRCAPNSEYNTPASRAVHAESMKRLRW